MRAVNTLPLPLNYSFWFRKRLSFGWPKKPFKTTPDFERLTTVMSEITGLVLFISFI